jgi:ubiquinone/menaquinone biosynthesis C-methylase UbiE
MLTEAGERLLEDARNDPKLANALYHDAAARAYDAKWGISFDERCIRYVRERAQRMLPQRRYGKVLEIGVGTGFFILNLWQAGFVQHPYGCDISVGMLDACAESARRLGCDVGLRTADAESLPYPDGAFDLVVGHAFLHHLPEPAAALAEAHRVLAPGGGVFVAGEPTRLGDRLAKRVGAVTARGVRAAGRLVPGLRKPPATEPRTEQERILRDLEWGVDLHTFVPAQVESLARGLGFVRVRVETEELVSSVFGWAVRTLEAEVRRGLLGYRWSTFAYRGWRSLYAVDRLLYGLVSKDRFYNLLLYGEKDG